MRVNLTWFPIPNVDRLEVRLRVDGIDVVRQDARSLANQMLNAIRDELEPSLRQLCPR